MLREEINSSLVSCYINKDLLWQYNCHSKEFKLSKCLERKLDIYYKRLNFFKEFKFILKDIVTRKVTISEYYRVNKDIDSIIQELNEYIGESRTPIYSILMVSKNDYLKYLNNRSFNIIFLYNMLLLGISDIPNSIIDISYINDNLAEICQVVNVTK